AQDEELRAMYPEEDLGPAEERLRLFFMQYWGGPRTYSEQRGHPRLRMRHVPFRIGIRVRDLWLKHMRVAMDSREMPEPLERQLWEYMVMAAHSMVNVSEEGTRPQVRNPTTVTVSSDDVDDDDGEVVTLSMKSSDETPWSPGQGASCQECAARNLRSASLRRRGRCVATSKPTITVLARRYTVVSSRIS